MSEEKLKSLKAQYNFLLEDRQSWEPDWQSLAKCFLPRRCRLLEKGDRTNKGGLRYDVLDGTGIRAMRVLAAGMHGGMTSPARPWFRLTLADEELAAHNSVKPWLNEVQKRMRNLFSRSNFYMAVHNLYNEIGTFGTSLMFEHPDARTGLRFNTLTAGEYVLDIDQNGRVDTAIRSMELSAKNMISMFGEENCSRMVREAYAKASTKLKKFEVIHALLPREERDPRKINNRNMPLASYYWEKSSTEHKFLRESGYNALPGFGVRWDVTGQDTYGRSPAMDSLGDTRMLQSVRASYLKQEHKRGDPPLAKPAGVDKVNSLPGGITTVASAGADNAIYPLYQVNPDTSGMLEITMDIRQAIREGLYNDLFKMLSMGPARMTATEVVERHEEKLLQLGPVLERLHDEFFIPLIDRTFLIMLEEDMLPPWPEELDQQPLKVDFVSLLAQAQKMVATASVDQYMGFIGTYGEAFPNLLDIPNVDEIGDSYADYLGLEAKLLNTREERKASRDAKAQAAQQAQMTDAAGSMAGTAKTLADASVRGGESSALDELLAGVGGAA